MCSRVYLLDGGETVGIYSEVEHEVLKIILNPLPTLKMTLSPSSTPHSRGGAAPFARRSLMPGRRRDPDRAASRSTPSHATGRRDVRHRRSIRCEF